MADDVTRLPGTEKKARVVQPIVEDFDPAISDDGYGSHCQHRHITVHTDRRVWCRDCKVHIDPVDYILALASNWEWYRQQLRQTSGTIEQKRLDLAELERRERNAKARMRKATPAELVRARQAVEKASRAIWRTREAMHELGIDPDDSLYRKLAEADVGLVRSAAELDPDPAA